MQKIRQEDYFLTSFCFLEKLCMKYEEMVSTYFLIYLGKPGLGHTLKTNFIIFQTVDPEICSILIFYKRFGLASPQHFVYDFSRKILRCIN